ncbi:hypothetical protein [Halalkalirubrum salinum]|uniref:hypothetical protein n=1 Tax=Halalkalirubrum salinum TaxID=2563889 RepID=UPI0010FB0C43|nr:hypothetical protein [Halalkalirubrum salinum]
MVDRTTETRVTTETVDRYVCPNCEQKYDEKEMVSIGLGISRETKQSVRLPVNKNVTRCSEISAICENCSENIFDYNGENGDLLHKNASEFELPSKTLMESLLDHEKLPFFFWVIIVPLLILIIILLTFSPGI